jgi:GTP-binding protein
MFIDEAKIYVKAGDGGKGCESFHKDKSMRYPRPDGGDGGRGGHIVMVAHRSVRTLLDFRFQQHYKAERGLHGGSRGKKGRSGKDCLLKVPQGTLIRDAETGLLLKDLTEHGQEVIICEGGSGGRGNGSVKFLTQPKLGDEKRIHLELKLIADVGLIGFPNAGKSSIISKVTKVRSKIANYPFTTKRPILGFVDREDDSFIIADLPGLIEGAHQGRGLGDRFLKHAERTKILVHVVDMSGSEGRDPVEDFRIIDHEIRSYSEEFLRKQRFVVANKMDCEASAAHLDRFKKRFGSDIYPVSAVTGDGLETLITRLCSAVKDDLCEDNFQNQ